MYVYIYIYAYIRASAPSAARRRFSLLRVFILAEVFSWPSRKKNSGGEERLAVADGAAAATAARGGIALKSIAQSSDSRLMLHDVGVVVKLLLSGM